MKGKTATLNIGGI